MLRTLRVRATLSAAALVLAACSTESTPTGPVTHFQPAPAPAITVMVGDTIDVRSVLGSALDADAPSCWTDEQQVAEAIDGSAFIVARLRGEVSVTCASTRAVQGNDQLDPYGQPTVQLRMHVVDYTGEPWEQVNDGLLLQRHAGE